MKRFQLMLLAVGISLAGVGIAAESVDDATALLASADVAYGKRLDLTQDRSAFESYQRIARIDPEHAVEANWKAARAGWWLAHHTAAREDQLKLYQRSIELARGAVAAEPNSAAAHFWLGVALGSYGEAKGILKSLSMVGSVRQEMAAVLRIDPKFLGGGAYRVLGVVDYKVPKLVGGSRTRARAELEKALQLGPADPFTHYYLADLYRLLGETEKSRAELATLSALQVPPGDEPELVMVKEEAARNFK